ncbi:MAG: hypothetical protein JWN04_6539 [Myxococcaceae bacterium]|nr:hypothetical protein [Myxococcaceae bacterium]
MKLLELILGLPEARIEELAARWHIAIDRKKRLTAAEQVARGMVQLPRWLEQARLSDGAREALRLLAAAPRGLALGSLPDDVHALIDQGFVYHDPQRSTRVLLPAAFRLQLPGSPSDSPRAARLLLSAVPEEARRELCQYHLARLPPLPWPMLLETALERLEDATWVKQELGKLAESERALLSAIDGAGGEAGAEEVLELSREPVRIAHGGTVQVPRRSAIFALARRGFTLARGDGWIIPDEIERVVGRERRLRAGVERQRLLMSRHVLDLTPARAELAQLPSYLTAVLLAELASHEQLPPEGRGLSRVALRRAALQLVIAPERAELLACLARADGLLYATTPLSAVSERLWNAWRRGGAWDEAAREPDMFRPGHPTTAKATQLVRESLLETLTLLPPLQFALASDVLATAASDRRAPAAQRALSLAARLGQDVVPTVAELSRAVLERSLPFLGLIDIGQIAEGTVLRLSSAARTWFDHKAADGAGSEPNEPQPRAAAEWRGERRLWCGGACSVSSVLEAARYGRAWLDDAGVSIELTDESLSRGADHDPDLAGLRAALSSLVTSVPEVLQRAIEAATAQRPLFGLARVGAFLEMADAALRRALYEDSEGAAVFAAPPLQEGLLVRAGVSESRVHALLMRHGARLYTRE